MFKKLKSRSLLKGELNQWLDCKMPTPGERMYKNVNIRLWAWPLFTIRIGRDKLSVHDRIIRMITFLWRWKIGFVISEEIEAGCRILLDFSV